MGDRHTTNASRALLQAIGAGVLAAICTMIVPVSLMGNLAPRALLDDETRAFIAFAVGATTLISLAVIWLWSGRGDHEMRETWAQLVDDPAFREPRSKGYLAIKMPWHHNHETEAEPLQSTTFPPEHNASNIGEFNDSLNEDLLELTPSYQIPADDEDQHGHDVPIAASEVGDEVSAEPSITNMVDQLEAAIAIRHQKLAEMSAQAFSIDLAAAGSASEQPAKSADPGDAGESRRPFLELVPSTPVIDDDADSALAAALATLERMTVLAR